MSENHRNWCEHFAGNHYRQYGSGVRQ